MSYKLNEVNVDKSALLATAYRAADLVDKTFTITDVTFVNGDYGEYMICSITGVGLEAGRKFSTGATNIMARIRAAIGQGKLPLEVKVVKLGGNAFDVE